ncbi:MAG: prephenate dehydratase domain-containing protein [Sulfolobaceae archaeon]|nr:prephenate dehydratase domain-containing protein [Sulfolobaceae archaeon]
MYYLGPKGSFSHEVAELLDGNKIAVRSITEIFEKVKSNTNSIGVIPIENSREGPVHESLDNLYNHDQIYVKYEIEKKIELVLAANPAINEIHEIKKVYSHYHAIQESKETLRMLGISNIIPVDSTSTAASIALEERGSAAICSKYAAKLYGLKILLDNIQDGINLTRFLIISRDLSLNGDKSMLFFTIPHKPGSLYHVLGKFYKYNINLTMIYSRPLKTVPWQYYFYLEFEGELEEERVKKAIEELKEVTTSLKIKGSFSRLQYQA